MTFGHDGDMRYDGGKTVLVFDDRRERSDAVCVIVESLGERVAGQGRSQELLDRLAGQAVLDAVIVEFGPEQGPSAALLDGIEHHAGLGRHKSVVIVPRDSIDLAAACMSHPNISLLCEPTTLERGFAIAAALARVPRTLQDVNADGAPPTLRQISDEVSRIAHALASLTHDDAPSFGVISPTPAARDGGKRVHSSADAASLTRTIIRARRLREQFFQSDLFADPAWDMLLDLTAARLEKRQVAVSSLCIAASVPPTTALRWIKTLTDRGVLVRTADPSDGRRVFIDLSEPAADAMMAYIHAFNRIAPSGQ